LDKLRIVARSEKNLVPSVGHYDCSSIENNLKFQKTSTVLIAREKSELSCKSGPEKVKQQGTTRWKFLSGEPPAQPRQKRT
jgi:hypothetical protein